MGTSVHLRTLCKTVFLRHFGGDFNARRGGMRQREILGLGQQGQSG